MAASALLTGHTLLVFLVHVTIVLTGAVVLGRIAVRIGLPPLVGELTAGVLLGPGLWSHVPAIGHWVVPGQPVEMAMIDAIGQLGVILMVGIAGMHLDLAKARKRYRVALRISAPGLVIPFGLGAGVAFLIPAGMRSEGASLPIFAMFIGVALCVSAVPVIAKTLLDMRLIERNVGQLILMAGSIDDAVGWLLLSVVSASAATGLAVGGVFRALVMLAIMVAVTVTVGRLAVNRIMRSAAASRDGQLVATGAAVVLILVFATLSQAMHLEAVLGAFLCGTLLRTALEPLGLQLENLRLFVLSVLAPFYFATAGMRLDLGSLLTRDAIVAGSLVIFVAIVGKFLGAAIGGALSGMRRWETIAVGAGMNARGVVEIVVATVGLNAGILTPSMYSVIVLLAIVTSVMAPPILRFAMARVSVAEEEKIGPLVDEVPNAIGIENARKE